jgi:hypothetical protein
MRLDIGGGGSNWMLMEQKRVMGGDNKAWI